MESTPTRKRKMTEGQALFEQVLEAMLMRYVDLHPYASVHQLKREVRRVANSMREQMGWQS